MERKKQQLAVQLPAVEHLFKQVTSHTPMPCISRRTLTYSSWHNTDGLVPSDLPSLSAISLFLASMKDRRAHV